MSVNAVHVGRLSLFWKEFWKKVEAAHHRLLCLDYDGTLAQFHQDRTMAVPAEGVNELLEDLCRHTSTDLAIVSGRPVEELLTLIGELPSVAYVGNHGWETRSASGTYRIHQPLPVQMQGLVAVERELTSRGLTAYTERKTASVALHSRPMQVGQATAVLASIGGQLRRLAEEHDLDYRTFNGGIEVRCPQRDKGVALAELVSGVPPGSLIVYLGDDETDEDAFRFLQSVGVGIKIGNPGEWTYATAVLEDTSQVVQFLRQWRATVYHLTGDAP